MSCLFNWFSKGQSNERPRGPKLPPISDVDGNPKPTFCIYDSDDSDDQGMRFNV